MYKKKVRLPVDGWHIDGDLTLPVSAGSLVIFSGATCRFEPQANQLARYLNEAGYGTLLFNLMTSTEVERMRRWPDIEPITDRLMALTLWIHSHSEYRDLGIGYMGFNIGGAAALRAAGELGSAINAVVAQSPRSDLAFDNLGKIVSPTLIIVGELDFQGLTQNHKAFEQLQCEKQLIVLPGASHSLQEPGKFEQAGKDATLFFKKHMPAKNPDKAMPLDITKRR